MGLEGQLVLLTRSADLRQAHITSTIEDVRIWVDREDSASGADLQKILSDKPKKMKIVKQIHQILIQLLLPHQNIE